jgi:hypothetical protein
MLIEFSVANFRSVLSRQTLSLAANDKDDHLARNVSSAGEDVGGVLRSAVIYGPNAAGKSNLLRALQTLQLLVVNSAVATQEGQVLPVSPFLLDKTSAARPCEFGIVFVADDATRYEYFCALTSQRVEKEWLVAYPRGRSQRWFEREFQRDTQTYDWWFGPNFKGERAEKKVWQEFTRSNSLFFSTAIQLNNEQLKPAFNWIAPMVRALNQPPVNSNSLRVPSDSSDRSNGTSRCDAVRRRARQESASLHHAISRYSVERKQKHEGRAADLYDA